MLDFDYYENMGIGLQLPGNVNYVVTRCLTPMGGVTRTVKTDL